MGRCYCMPRPLRSSLLPGYPLHVYQRGHNKARVFASDADHTLYLGLLQQYSSHHACAVHAYALMGNHVHLLLSPPDVPAISRMMRSVNQIFGQHLNRSTNRCGSVWQGRFNACLVDTHEYFLTCQRYIELNPVRAGLADAPCGYTWSSYATNAEGRRSTLIVPHERYLQLGLTTSDRQAAYRGLFGRAIDAELLARIRRAIQRNRPLGSDSFAKEVERLLEEKNKDPAPAVGVSEVPVPYLTRTWPRFGLMSSK